MKQLRATFSTDIAGQRRILSRFEHRGIGKGILHVVNPCFSWRELQNVYRGYDEIKNSRVAEKKNANMKPSSCSATARLVQTLCPILSRDSPSTISSSMLLPVASGVAGNLLAIRSGTSSGVMDLKIGTSALEKLVLTGVPSGVGGSRLNSEYLGDLGLSSCWMIESRFAPICVLSGRIWVKPWDEATCSMDLKYWFVQSVARNQKCG